MILNKSRQQKQTLFISKSNAGYLFSLVMAGAIQSKNERDRNGSERTTERKRRGDWDGVKWKKNGKKYCV